jgi:hypothetical protein
MCWTEIDKTALLHREKKDNKRVRRGAGAMGLGFNKTTAKEAWTYFQYILSTIAALWKSISTGGSTLTYHGAW